MRSNSKIMLLFVLANPGDPPAFEAMNSWSRYGFHSLEKLIFCGEVGIANGINVMRARECEALQKSRSASVLQYITVVQSLKIK